MVSGQIETPSGETVEIDFSAMEERLDAKSKERWEQYKKELKDYKPESGGKGVIESRVGPNSTKLIEQLRDVSRKPITEQWTIVIPSYTAYEPAAHLRDYVFVTDVIKGKPGEIVHIPYVKDFDFTIITPEADTLTAKTIIGTTDTAIKEAGAYSDVPYADIEMINQNLLDEINRVFAHAAVRAEDKALIELVAAGTTNSFAGEVNLPHSTGSLAFYADSIPTAIGLLIKAGKEVHPGDLVLYMNARPYAALLKELAGTQAVTYVRGDIVTKGIVEDYLGVRILVGAKVNSEFRAGSGTGTCELAFLMRAKRTLALAPKRDILIETDRFIKERKLRITGSHTFSVALLDCKEAVRIFCNSDNV